MNLFDLYAKLSLDDSDYTSKVRDAGDAGDSLANKLKSGLGSAGGIVSKGLTVASGAAVAFGGALLAVEANTEEYRAELGRLDTAYEAAGYSTDTARQAFSDFYGILGETDTAVEASQLLAKLALNEQDMTTWTDIAAGVWGTFGQSLPIEGLIESANETAKVGEVTGSLADALNWAGISEDEFNARLAECGSEAERNQLIMETLSGEYDAAADSFYKNNEALIQSRDNQLKLQDALAKVGDAVSIFKGKIIAELLPTVSQMAENLANFISGIDPSPLATAFSAILSVIKTLAPAITAFVAAAATIKGILTVVQIVNQVKTAFTAFFAVLTANPFMIIVAAVVSLISFLVSLWMTNENFRNAVTAAWEQIKQAFVTAWEVVSSVWGAATEFFSGIAEGIKSAFSTVQEFLSTAFSAAWDAIVLVWSVVVGWFQEIYNGIKDAFSTVAADLGALFSSAWEAIVAVWDAVVGWFQEVYNGIKGAFSTAAEDLGGLFSDAWDAVKDAWSDVKSYFSGKYSDIKGVFSNAITDFTSIGQNLMSGLKQGIENMASSVISAAQAIVDKVKGAISSALDINSPSKWAIETFGYVMEGAAKGLEQGLPGLLKTTSGVVDSFQRSVAQPLAVSTNMGTQYNAAGVLNGGGYSPFSSAPITIQQHIQAVPMTPVELARQSVNAFDRLRWR